MLGYALGNRFKAFLAGLGVTSILQSSTATGLMTTAFAAGGLVDPVPGPNRAPRCARRSLRLPSVLISNSRDPSSDPLIASTALRIRLSITWLAVERCATAAPLSHLAFGLDTNRSSLASRTFAHRAHLIEIVRFAADSPLEEDGFEPSVPSGMGETISTGPRHSSMPRCPAASASKRARFASYTASTEAPHRLSAAAERERSNFTLAAANCAQRPTGKDTPPRPAPRPQGSRWCGRGSPGAAAA